MNQTSSSFKEGPVQETDLHIHVHFSELAGQLRMSSSKPAVLDAAVAIFEQHNRSWKPAFIYSWFGFSPGVSNGSGKILVSETQSPVVLEMGHSVRFISKASRVLAAVYTAGPELDKAAAKADSEGDFLGAHVLDLLGLLVLGKVEDREI